MGTLSEINKKIERNETKKSFSTFYNYKNIYVRPKIYTLLKCVKKLKLNWFLKLDWKPWFVKTKVYGHFWESNMFVFTGSMHFKVLG